MYTRFAIVLSTLALPAAAQQHAHGEAEAFIAEQDKTWQISLRIPAHDAVGFEHSAQSAKEKQALASFMTLSDTAQNMLVMDESCRLENQEVALPQHMSHDDDGHHEDEHHGHEEDEHHGHEEGHHDEHDEHDEHDHDEHDEHDHDEHDEHEEHDHDEHGGEHSDIELTYTYRCEQTPESIRFTAFSALPSLQKLEVQWFTSAGQGAQTLSPGKQSVDW